MSGSARFVLASASPARLATLRAAGLAPEVIVSGVDEDAVTAATSGLGITAAAPAELVAALATAKASAVAASLEHGVVLGCDSMLELDGAVLGKPHTADIAVRRWKDMRGRVGALHTGHHLLDVGSGRSVTRTGSTRVRFADVTDDEIVAYVGTGEPLGVAGAFTLDGLGGWFVEGVDGDPHNVVGVSLPLLRSMLRELGLGLTDVGYPDG